MSDDSGETQTIVQSQDTAPWSGQQEFLKTGFERAKTDVLDRQLGYFPGSTVTPFSSQTEQALGMAENRALAGSPLTQAAQGEAGKVLSGDYLNGGNPAFQGMVDRAVQPLTQQYQNTVRPGIMSAFTGAGRSGSNIARAQAENTAGNDYMRQVGDIGSALSYANYNDERNRMGAMTQLAPQLAQQDYFDIGQLQNVGGQREAMSQAQLQDQVNRFNFAQQEPTNRLGQYMGLVQGGYGTSGTGSRTQPVQSGNPIMQGLGGGLAGVGILNGLFGGGSSSLFTNPFK
jgi:hypothetical protein